MAVENFVPKQKIQSTVYEVDHKILGFGDGCSSVTVYALPGGIPVISVQKMAGHYRMSLLGAIAKHICDTYLGGVGVDSVLVFEYYPMTRHGSFVFHECFALVHLESVDAEWRQVGPKVEVGKEGFDLALGLWWGLAELNGRRDMMATV